LVGNFGHSENRALVIIEQKIACRELQKFADQTGQQFAYTEKCELLLFVKRHYFKNKKYF
jgi:hypothetical protein